MEQPQALWNLEYTGLELTPLETGSSSSLFHVTVQFRSSWLIISIINT